ncbi:MAG: GIY-YIG nuclease family protein [Pirellulales bacterium]|nr:GIY-YIG nuclease family protein [Pirellulales bacterium]
MATEHRIKPLGIVELLELRGFDKSKPTKFVRHTDRKRCNVNELLRNRWLEFYQATQGKPIFRNCQQIVVFIGTAKTKARFHGVYSVGEEHDDRKLRPPQGYPRELSKYRYYYDLKRQSRYNGLENRLVVEWGANAISWHQWYNQKGKEPKDKEVIELLPDGQTLSPFTDYLNFTLKHSELKQLVNNADANREWRASLAAVAGVYLILATKSGRQYIGSAYGAKGIWGRWTAYAKNGHGDNELLKKLLAKNSSYPEAFTYSILQILPKSMKPKEVVKYEQQYKQKLGTQATGLNGN